MAARNNKNDDKKTPTDGAKQYITTMIMLVGGVFAAIFIGSLILALIVRSSFQ